MDKSNRFDEQIKTFLVTFFFPIGTFHSSFNKFLSRWLELAFPTKELREPHVDSNAQSLYRKYRLLAVHGFEENTDSLSLSI